MTRNEQQACTKRDSSSRPKPPLAETSHALKITVALRPIPSKPTTNTTCRGALRVRSPPRGPLKGLTLRDNWYCRVGAVGTTNTSPTRQYRRLSRQ
jgi:hypothetical protein